MAKVLDAQPAQPQLARMLAVLVACVVVAAASPEAELQTGPNTSSLLAEMQPRPDADVAGPLLGQMSNQTAGGPAESSTNSTSPEETVVPSASDLLSPWEADNATAMDAADSDPFPDAGEAWNVSAQSKSASEDSMGVSLLAAGTGYMFSATTTRYGHTPSTACGGINTMELVRGTNYIVVASAQSMQSLFPQPNGCGWECLNGLGRRIDRCPHSSCGHGQDGRPLNGCSCRQLSSCFCGRSEVGTAGLGGTAPLGCFTCARGRFLRKRPYFQGANDGQFQTGEIKVVVADVCPYGSNSKWCPARPGESNACGEKNHLDFTAVPAGIDNHYFVFTPEDCPQYLMNRMARGKWTCSRSR